MLSLYEILKASKTGVAPDMWTALAGMNWSGADSGHEVKELTGIPPLSFTADGTPLLDYLISGNMSQSGTPTPENPVMPQGTGERTENLFASVWEQGSINGTTGQNEVAGTLVRTKDYIPIKPNTAYSFSRDISDLYMNVRLYRADKSYIGSGSDSTIRLITGSTVPNPMGSKVSFCCFEVIDGEAAYIRFNDASNNTATKWLMVEGEYTWQTMPDYEPYGYKIPILSANTTTPVYLGEVETTRRIKKLVLTGEENFFKNSNLNKNYLYYAQKGDILPDSRWKMSALCNELPVKTEPPISDIGINTTNTFGVVYFNFGAEVMNAQPSGNTVAGLKEYLAQQYANGTPVTVWYVLAEPTTGIVNEPLRKIGDYADTVSYEQAEVQIPTNKGNTVIDVETTLKPSQMYIKYQE